MRLGKPYDECWTTHHMHGLRMMREEVCNAPSLLQVVLGVGLQSVHHVCTTGMTSAALSYIVVANPLCLVFPGQQALGSPIALAPDFH